MLRKSKSLGVCLVVVSAVLLVGNWGWQRMAPESAPVARGAAYAESRGCVSCHGDPENPQADAYNLGCADTNEMPWHPDYAVECTDVMAYFETVRLRRTFDDRALYGIGNPLIEGERLVRKYHCFNCHGHLGQGGFNNPGSLKGYVPGYFGADFRALTNSANPESVREWIMHGMNSAILKTPFTGQIAKYFFSKQAVSMPSYKSLDSEEVEILVRYVIALNGFGPMTAKVVRSYGEQSRSSEGLVGIDYSGRLKTMQTENGPR